MSASLAFQSVDEVYAATVRARRLPTNQARTLPVPTRGPGGPELVVMHFGQPAVTTSEWVYPPHYVIRCDALRGNVLTHAWRRPSEWPVDEACREPVNGFGLDHVTTGEFRAALEAVRALAPAVWRRFFGLDPGDPEEPTTALAQRFAVLFARSTYRPLLPFYAAVAPDFFAWVYRHALLT